MIRLLQRRLLETAILVFLLSLLIFGLFAAIPGDYLSEMELNPAIPASQVERMRTEFGLDQPFHLQYFKWLGQIVQGNFGYSFAQRRPATSLIAERAVNTLMLACFALLFSLGLALPLAVVSSLYFNRWPDHLSRIISLGGMSIPTLLTSLLFLYLAFLTGWFPIGGAGTLRHVVLPALTLALPLFPFLTRTLRLELVDALSQPFITALRSKGLPRWRVFWYAFRYALNPIISLSGLIVGGLLSGSIVVERVFSWPGLGELTVASILSRDLYVALNCVLVASGMVIIANLAADIVLACNDPRVRA